MANTYSRYYTYIKPILENSFVKNSLKNKLVRSYSPYIFSVITIIILVIFAIRPTLMTILNLQKDIQNHRQTLQTLKDKTQNLVNGKKNLEALSTTDRGKIQSAIPENPDVISLIKSLRSSLPSQASGSAIQIQPLPLNATAQDKLHPEVGSVIFAFNIEGSFSQFLVILTSLAKSTRPVSIDSINISKQNEGATVMTLNGRGYYLK